MQKCSSILAFDHNAGSASAVMGFTRFLLASSLVALIDRVFHISPMVLGIVFIGFSGLSLLLVTKILD